MNTEEYSRILKGYHPRGMWSTKYDYYNNSPLPNIGLYRHYALEANEVKKQLQQLLEHGVIRPSTSPYGSPIIIVQKKDVTWRMCTDYKALKKITLNNQYPLPRIDGLLD
jgi:hypothetical protein